MPTSLWKKEDTARAVKAWADYQQTHDVTDRHGQAVGIDPASGRVWFGESAADVWTQAQAEGSDAPLFFLRVGYSYYQRKGTRQ